MVGQNTLPVAATAPGVFTSGGSQGLIVNADGTLNSASNPAAAGSIVYFYATGADVFQGPTLTDGQIVSTATTPTSTPAAKVGMELGTGTDIKITYKGPAPGFIAGLIQVNFLIPPSLTPNSAVPLTLNIGGVQSSAVTIAVH